MPGGSPGGFEGRRGEASGLRSSGEAADRDRAPRGGPRLPGLPAAHPRRLPRGGGFAGPVWRTLQGGGGLSQRPATRARRTDRADPARPVRGGGGLRGERGELGSPQGRGAGAGLARHRRLRRGGAGALPRRNGLAHRRPAPLAAHRLDPDPHLLSRRRAPLGRARVRGRRRGPRPLARLLRPRKRPSRLLQRPSPARASGGLRTRQGALGRGPARHAHRGQSGRAESQSRGRRGAPARNHQGVRGPLLGRRPRRPRPAPEPAGLRSLEEPEKAKEAAACSQSPHPLQNLQGRHPPLPHRLHRSLHQQPRRAGSEDDEGEDQNLRRIPNPARRPRLRTPALRHLVGPKAGPPHPHSPHSHPRPTRRRTQALSPGSASPPRQQARQAPAARYGQPRGRLGSYGRLELPRWALPSAPTSS